MRPSVGNFDQGRRLCSIWCCGAADTGPWSKREFITSLVILNNNQAHFFERKQSSTAGAAWPLLGVQLPEHAWMRRRAMLGKFAHIQASANLPLIDIAGILVHQPELLNQPDKAQNLELSCPPPSHMITAIPICAKSLNFHSHNG